MNIFVLDYNVEQCAEYHCDKHIVKMILESVQMICTNHSMFSLKTLDFEDIPYKSTHAMHPCTIWARESKQNYIWLCDLVEALHNEWQYRFDEQNVDNYEPREHKSYTVFKNLNHELMQQHLPDIGLQPFAQALPEEHKCGIDAVEGYRKYYAKDKAHILQYTKRSLPKWLKDYE